MKPQNDMISLIAFVFNHAIKDCRQDEFVDLLKYSKEMQFELRINSDVIDHVVLSQNYYILEPLIKANV